MTVGLEKFLLDIKNEKVLWQLQDQESFNAEEKEAAWKKISSTNKMPVSYAKSVFNVLAKKYHTEKLKSKSNWKLFQFLTFLDKTNEEETSNHEEEDEEPEGELIEVLEVAEEGDFGSKENSGDEDNLGPKAKTLNRDEKSEKLTQALAQIKRNYGEKKEAPTNQTDQLKKEVHKPHLNKIDSQQLLKALKAQKQKNESSPQINQKTDLKKFPGLTILRSPYPPQTKAPKSYKQTDTKVSTNVVNEKDSTGVETAKKLPPFENFLKRKIVPASAAAVIENGKNQELHRTVDEDAPPAKRVSKETQEKNHMKNTSDTQSSIKLESGQIRSEIDIKKEILIEGAKSQGISSIKSNINNNKKTINDMKSKIAQAMNSSNNTSHIKTDSHNIEVKQEVDSEDDSEENSNAESTNSSIEKKGSEYNCPNELLPKFFHGLYKSKTYDSFGMYVSSALNRLPLNLARKLELKILQSILEINSLNTE